MVEIEGMKLPDDLYYTDRHLWVKIEDGFVRIGGDDFFRQTIGKIVFIRLPKPDSEVKQNQEVGTVESMKWVERLRAPLSGKIKDVNTELRMKPALVVEDNYGKGWMFTIVPSNLDSELKTLLHGDVVGSWLQKDINEKIKKKK